MWQGVYNPGRVPAKGGGSRKRGRAMTSEHAAGGFRAEVLALMGGARSGALATLLTDGGPYLSLVNVAPADDGEAILLLSQLAWHTRNIAADPRAGLLYSAAEAAGDPLEGPRLSLVGSLARDDREDSRTLYLRRHPGAGRFADFRDFNFYCFTIAKAHYVGGFGRIETFTRSQLLDDGS